MILHERLGNWNRQLRPRLHDQPVRWFETRSRADLDRSLTGLGAPVVLIDLGRNPIEGLSDLAHLLERSSDARVLVLDPESHEGVAETARELGATHVASGFVTPPFVADLLAKWINLAQSQIERDGWSASVRPESDSDPWGWLAEVVGDPDFLKPTKPQAIAESLPHGQTQTTT